METKVLLMVGVFLIVAAALFYFVLNAYSTPYSYKFKPTNVTLSSSEGSECTPGEQRPCVASAGCPGVKECLHGYWSECIVKKQCDAGQVEVCEVDACKDGYRECGECSQWGPCEPRESSQTVESCAANSSS